MDVAKIYDIAGAGAITPLPISDTLTTLAEIIAKFDGIMANAPVIHPAQVEYAYVPLPRA